MRDNFLYVPRTIRKRWAKGYTLGQRLGLVVGLIAMLSVGLITALVGQSNVMRADTLRSNQYWELALATRTLAHAVEHTALVGQAILSEDDSAVFKSKIAKLDAAIGHLDAIGTDFVRKFPDLLGEADRKRIDLSLKEFVAYQRDTVELSKKVSQKAALIQALDDATIKDRERIVADMEAIARSAVEMRSTLHAKASAFSMWFQRIIVGIALAMTLLAIATAIWVVRRHIQQPIKEIVKTMQAIVAHRFEISIPHSARADEIGEIARALSVLKESAAAKARMDAEQGAVQAAAAAARTAAEKAAIDRERQLVSAQIGKGLSALAAQDLTFRLDDEVPEAYAALRRDFNRAMQQLEAAVAGLSRNAASIKTGSGEIASAALDLSHRTEQQATNVEQASSALQGITSDMRAVSEHASRIGSVVARTTDDARGSETVVLQAISAMNALRHSSQSITQIITVIDDIAFQTNLLALNAGVEAARAGDAGRGFAVVAAEVRGLAQRSAGAAKEIKQLISGAIARIDEGTGLVAHTGEALRRIVTQIVEINTMSSTMASTISSQASALHQVSVAVVDLDKTTQQNAAMAEQASTCARVMAQESACLASTVSTFRIDHDRQCPAEPLQRAA